MYHNDLVATSIYSMTTQAKATEIKDSISAFCLFVEILIIGCQCYKNSHLIGDDEQKVLGWNNSVSFNVSCEN